MYAVIGDLVGSRAMADRALAHRVLVDALADTAERLPGVQPLEVTVGDEFQGAWASVGEATLATLLVRLATLPVIDVRCGIGAGETTVLDSSRSPLIQDGPAWWSARAAVEEMDRPRRSGVRTWMHGPDGALVTAHLLCRDALVDRLSERGWRMLRLALCGDTQRRIAEAEGISRSAVSQQFARGITAVTEAQRLLAAGGEEP